VPYTSRFGGPDLIPEEHDVATALAAYARAQATFRDWVPTSALWRAYCDWRACYRWRRDDEQAPALTVRQFGRAVRRVFPGVHRCKRSFHGKQQWGYATLCGPESVVTRQPRGGKKRLSPSEPLSSAQALQTV